VQYPALACHLLAVYLVPNPGKSRASKGESEKAFGRIKRIKALDDKNADADLLKGMIEYYFDQPNSDQAVKTLKQALNHGVNVPEVINLVNREEKVLEQRRQALDQFLQLVKKYLNDASVPLNYARN